MRTPEKWRSAAGNLSTAERQVINWAKALVRGSERDVAGQPTVLHAEKMLKFAVFDLAEAEKRAKTRKNAKKPVRRARP